MSGLTASSPCRAHRWRDVVRIHRLEYPFPIHYLCHATVGACYAVGDARHLLSLPVLIVSVANLLLLVAGNPINAVADIATDAATAGKSDIAEAARRLGPRHPVVWTAVEMACALTLAAAVSWWLDRPLIVVFLALAAVLCLLYNVEPVRLKRRGLANPITLALYYGLLPALAGWQSVRTDLDPRILLIFCGVTVLLTGRTLWWSIPDRVGDAASGIATPVVRHGTVGALLIAAAATTAGLGLLGWGLLTRYGLAAALFGLIAGGIFLIGNLAMLRRIRGGAVPDATRMRKRLLYPVTVFDLSLVLIPVAALVW